jgi:hypothetical protein
VAFILLPIRVAEVNVADSSHQAFTSPGDNLINVYQFSAKGSFIDNIVLQHSGHNLEGGLENIRI